VGGLGVASGWYMLFLLLFLFFPFSTARFGQRLAWSEPHPRFVCFLVGTNWDLEESHCSFEWHLTPHMTLSIETCIFGHSVLSGHYSIPRGCPLNTGFTVYGGTASKGFLVLHISYLEYNYVFRPFFCRKLYQTLQQYFVKYAKLRTGFSKLDHATLFQPTHFLMSGTLRNTHIFELEENAKLIKRGKVWNVSRETHAFRAKILPPALRTSSLTESNFVKNRYINK